MDKKSAQQNFNERYKELGGVSPVPNVKQVTENKHGVDNPVIDLNIHGRPGQGFPLSALESIPDHTYVGNISGGLNPPTSLSLGINTTFLTEDGKRVTVVNGLVTIATSTSTSSTTHSTSSSSSISSSSSSSSVSTSSSSSSVT